MMAPMGLFVKLLDLQVRKMEYLVLVAVIWNLQNQFWELLYDCLDYGRIPFRKGLLHPGHSMNKGSLSLQSS